MKWYSPVICGHVGFVAEQLGEYFLEFCVISRRQTMRAGTRLNVRGIDDHGHVANYVETEQILKIGDEIYSHVITRGSVPIFWAQNGKGTSKLMEDVIITRSTEMTREAFTKHFSEMIADYKEVFCVDLLQD